MAKKISGWKTKGMNRDLSVSAFNPEFAFENINLRLSTNDGNTLLSWVNEKGTAPIFVSGSGINAMYGFPIGTAVLNHQLVVFTHRTDVDKKPDYIYKLEYTDADKTAMTCTKLYNGNLKFDLEYPLETLVSYEADYIQKVYWTDSINQPRMINIAAATSTIAKWNDTSFDFVPAMQMAETVSVTKRVSSGGMFAPGAIQYCFNYYNRYGQQSNIAWVSPIYYVSHKDRGAAADDKVSNSFTISIKDLDTRFDYVRLYSIHRTSINSTPIVKLLTDISIAEATGNKVSFTDNGTLGSSMDPTELYYIGGKEIHALTMIDKDNTLFLGNISQVNTLIDDIQTYIRNNIPIITFQLGGAYKIISVNDTKGVYAHTNMLNKNLREMSTFKGGETYRLGFQLQKHTGEWLEPIFINDIMNEHYPKTSWVAGAGNLIIQLAYAEGTINLSDVPNIDLSVFKKIRPVIVYPNLGDRNVICQGVLNPTVFNVEDRMNKSPYAQSSWYFRPYMKPYDAIPTFEIVEPTITKYAYTPGDDVDLTLQDYFIKNPSYTKTVYVMNASATEDTIKEIRNKGYINASKWSYSREKDNSMNDHNDVTSEHCKLEGIISLGNNRYAFLKATSWIEEYNINRDITYDYEAQNEYGEAYWYEDAILDLSGGRVPFTMCGLSRTSDYQLYYTKPDNTAPNNALLKYYSNSNYYVVSFPETLGAATTSNNSGERIRFRHYSSLFSQDDFEKKDKLTDPNPNNYYAAKRLEIQGAWNKYESPFSKKSETLYHGRDSNTQFFVDQSIITLHSPDVEFDTAVQTYDMDNLRLRVIGVVPITANVSAHHISLSTNIGNGVATGEKEENVVHNVPDLNAGKRLVSEFLWNDGVVVPRSSNSTDSNGGVTEDSCEDFLVSPWQRAGSLNNDWRSADVASSQLRTKKESNLLYSSLTEYLSGRFVNFSKLSAEVYLQENDYVTNIRLPKQKGTSSEINYYPNVDKVLYVKDGYLPLRAFIASIYNPRDDSQWKDEFVSTPIPMKYKSSSHIVVSLNANSSTGNIPILPYGIMTTYGNMGQYENGSGTTFWGDVGMLFDQSPIPLQDTITDQGYNFLWLGELYRNSVPNRFGGTSKEAIKANTWVIAGKEEDLVNGSATLRWTDGDTYYERYDCLKTYAFTSEDANQIVEILSFMCETRVNIDGRYDKNRGQIDNTAMSPQVFNLLNPVYSQQNNFFSYKQLNYDGITKLEYPNMISYSMTKESGADVDKWTDVTLASALELDGDKGSLNSLNRFNNQIIAFQDSGISHILYNENVQISATDGVPIELANSGKVEGKRYISGTIGCSNKWSIASTPRGLYFMDSNDKSIYLFNGELQNLSTVQGFNAWSKSNIKAPEIKWTPNGFENFVSYYDKKNQDILFIDKYKALAFSEKLGVFTSFYNYENTPYFCNLRDTGVWVKPYVNNMGTQTTSDDVVCTGLWKHNAGTYCNFFGSQQPFSMTLIGNPEPQMDKIFTNLEFRACVDGEGSSESVPYLPFNSLETWNEYQHGITTLNIRNGHDAFKHHDGSISSLKRKFRIWRCDIPRDNAVLALDAGLNITRFKTHPIDRMRNPWIYLKLMKNTSGSYLRTEIHDIMMTYFE